MLFLKQSLSSTFVCHNSATTFQVSSNKVSNAKLNFIKDRTMERAASPQQPHLRSSHTNRANFLRQPVHKKISAMNRQKVGSRDQR